MKHRKINSNNIKLAIYYCYPGAHQTAQKIVNYYMLNTLKKEKKIVEKFVKKVYVGEKHSFIELTYVVGAHWNCLNEAISMCTNNICY